MVKEGFYLFCVVVAWELFSLQLVVLGKQQNISTEEGNILMWEERRGFVKKESWRCVRGWPANVVGMWKITRKVKLLHWGCVGVEH